jgi:hypothetical protein
MEIAIFIIISYILGVALYTLVVRNNAMNKHNPFINIKEIIFDGMKDLAIGFFIVGILYLILSFVLKLIHLS